jgi:hypothetical protein
VSIPVRRGSKVNDSNKTILSIFTIKYVSIAVFKYSPWTIRNYANVESDKIYPIMYYIEFWPRHFSSLKKISKVKNYICTYKKYEVLLWRFKVVVIVWKLNLRELYGIYRHFQQHFSYIVAVRFIGGGNRNTQRSPQVTDKLYHTFDFILNPTCVLNINSSNTEQFSLFQNNWTSNDIDNDLY